LAHEFFEFRNAGAEASHVLGGGVRQVAMFQKLRMIAMRANDLRWDSYDGAVRWNGFHYDGTGSDLGIVADGDVPENFGAGSDDDAISDSWMSLAPVGTGATESDGLVDENVVTDLSGFANDDAHAVIYEEAAPDGCARVDFDAG
jgi:hypothetical protein